MLTLTACGSAPAGDADAAAAAAPRKGAAMPPSPAPTDGPVDLDLDGTPDRARIVTGGSTKGLTAIAVRTADGAIENAPLSGDAPRVEIALSTGARYALELPGARSLIALTDASRFPAELVLCWPLSAPAALIVRGDEGDIIIYRHEGELVQEACNA